MKTKMNTFASKTRLKGNKMKKTNSKCSDRICVIDHELKIVKKPWPGTSADKEEEVMTYIANTIHYQQHTLPIEYRKKGRSNSSRKSNAYVNRIYMLQLICIIR